ncbi:MAG: hypothetical protein O7G87_14990 [bacterium]|nr:hypothetical protein [bacterium]
MSQPQKLLIQIVFNLVLLLIFLVVLGAVIRNLLTQTGDLGENLFLLALLGAILFIGIGFLVKLIRSARSQEGS